MGAKYWAEVSYRLSTIRVCLEPVRVISGKWCVKWRNPFGRGVCWDGLPQVFDTAEDAQKALDAEAKARGLKPVREV